MFKKTTLALLIALSASFTAVAQDAATHTVLADGTEETRIPKIEQTCSQDTASQITNTLIGAAAGWFGTKAVSRAADVKPQNENLWAGGGAVAGALIGNNIDKLRVCEKLVGYTVLRTKDGKTTKTFEPVGQ